MLGSCTSDECRVEDKTVLIVSPCTMICEFVGTFGVFPLVLRARKSAFSAPRIWTVEAGYLAKLVKDPLLISTIPHMSLRTYA